MNASADKIPLLRSSEPYFPTIRGRIPRLALFDTNIFSYLAQHYSPGDLGILQQHLVATDVYVVMSPTVFVEILQTQEYECRNKILTVARRLCHWNILSSPEELTLDFIARRSGLPALRKFYSGLSGTGELAKIWSYFSRESCIACLDAQCSVPNFRLQKLLSEYVHAHFSRKRGLAELGKDWGEIIGATFWETLTQATGSLRKQPTSPVRSPVICENAMAAAFLMLCSGITVFPEIYDTFWAFLGCPNNQSRWSMLKETFPFVFREGPFWGLGAIAAAQSTTKYSEGNFFDCLHFSYLPSVDYFISNDLGYQRLSKIFPESENLKKIFNLNRFRGLLAGN